MSETTPNTPRRGFMKQLSATAVALAACLSPVGAALYAFVSPLGRKKSDGRFLPVAKLDLVPADGKPYRFSVVGDRRDAWTYYPPKPIGSVYLVRESAEATPVAFQTICPHLGCMIDWKGESEEFFCPCHNASFTPVGARTDPAKSPSPRDMDTLTVEIRDGEIWVDFRNFKSGTAQKVEV